MIVPLRYQLRNGDTVEIITEPEPEAEQGLAQARQDGARAHEDPLPPAPGAARARRSRSARELLDKALRKHDTTLDARREAARARGAASCSCETVDELIVQVGYGKITAQQVLEKALPELAQEGARPSRAEGREHAQDAAPQGHAAARRRAASRSPARTTCWCASRSAARPLPGDPIVGFITRGRGVTVHRRDCDKGLDLDPERRIDVEWDGKRKTQHAVAIQVLCADKPGLLAHISQSFTDQGVNICQAHCRATEDGRAVNTFHASRARSRSAQERDPLAVAHQGRVLSVDRVSRRRSDARGDATLRTRGERLASAGAGLPGSPRPANSSVARRGRLLRQLVLAAAARLLVLVLALDAGGGGVGGHDRSFVETRGF